MTTNQTERVSDEELDQMIWKLERDGMTPKMLSLMRELREVRGAKGEPVAWQWFYYKQWFVTNDQERARDVAEGGVEICPLYTAQPASGVPDTLPCPVILEPGLKFGKGVRTQCMLAALNRRAEYYAELDAMTPEQRADHDAGIAEFKAMLSPGNSEQLEPVSNRDELPMNSFTNEELAGMSHGDNPQANAYRELLAFRRNSPATQNGWIPVSERMPPEGAPLLVCSGNGVVQRTVYGFDGENWLDWYEQYDPVKAEPDDLWQPLPAAPKVVG